MAVFKKISPFKVLYPFRCQSSLHRVLGGNSSVFNNPKISNKVVEYPKRYSLISKPFAYFKYKYNEIRYQEIFHIRAGRIYEITNKVDFDYFMEYFGLPDSFNSWFLINELHVCLLMGRLLQEDKVYSVEKYNLVKIMWDDAESKAKAVLKLFKKKDMSDFFKILDGQFQYALLLYDEGILSSDMQLANALYIRFFQMDKLDPIQLEILISYIREQVKRLSEIPSSNFYQCLIDFKWSPLDDHIKLLNGIGNDADVLQCPTLIQKIDVPEDVPNVPTPDVNVYQQKKTLAQGMMDLALLSANANHLRYFLESVKRRSYYYPSSAYITLV